MDEKEGDRDSEDDIDDITEGITVVWAPPAESEGLAVKTLLGTTASVMHG